MRNSGEAGTHNHVFATNAAPALGTVRVEVVWSVPQFLREHGIDTEAVLAAAGIATTVFEDPDNLISYRQFERLLSEIERQTGLSDIALLIGRQTRLKNFGLAGRLALCAETAGEGLQRFCDLYNLHSTASAVTVVHNGDFARFVYAIVELGITETRHFQVGSAVMACNVLHDLFGPNWRPTAVTLACRAPVNARPLQRYVDAPVRFDCPETAVYFERHWLALPLPPVEPRLRAELEVAAQASRNAILTDFPATVRRIVRKQILLGTVSMTDVAALLSMHRRTLDRHLRECGTHYGEIVESIKEDIARQLLRETQMPIQQIAESVGFSTAANFATAFRRRSGMTPSAYRRQFAAG